MSPDTRAKILAGMSARWNLDGADKQDLEEIAEDDDCLADLVVINGLLSALFRSELAERDWLAESKKIFDGMPAITLMLDGKKSLRRVRETVQHMAGQ